MTSGTSSNENISSASAVHTHNISHESNIYYSYEQYDNHTIYQNSHFAAVNKCDFCVKVLQCVYGQLGKSVGSKRLLEHKLVGACKRYPEVSYWRDIQRTLQTCVYTVFQYRKTCLSMAKSNIPKIFNDLQPGTYDPVKTCTDLKVSYYFSL